MLDRPAIVVAQQAADRQRAVPATARTSTAGIPLRAGSVAIPKFDDRDYPESSGPPRSGRELVGMRERVDAFGGQLTNGAATSGAEFRVCAVFPVYGEG
jgi:hypothetical protein